MMKRKWEPLPTPILLLLNFFRGWVKELDGLYQVSDARATD
jgi:hypothetical protein